MTAIYRLNKPMPGNWPVHRVVFDTPFEVLGDIFPPGEYLADHTTLGLAVRTAPPRFLGNRQWFGDDSHTILVLPGVRGDLLMLTPLARKLQSEGKRVTVACMSRYAEVLAGVVPTLPLPLAITEDVANSTVLNMSHLTERREAIEGMAHPAKVAFQLAGRAYDDEPLKPSYLVTPDEKSRALQLFPRRDGVFRVAIQTSPSCQTRHYPRIGDVVRGLIRKLGRKLEIIYLEAPGATPIPKAMSPVIRSTSEFSLGMRDSAAVMSTSDVLFAPDSVFAHIACAIDHPAVIAMATFTKDERFHTGNPKFFVLRGSAPCAPCRHHVADYFNPEIFPRGCSIPATGKCAALDSIDATRAVNQIIKLLP